MTSLPYPHKILLLRSGFRYPERHLFFARARLFFDRIELSGWQLGERHEEVIPLDSVAGIEWREGEEQATTVLRLDDGRRIEVSLGDGRRWREALDRRMNWRPSRAPVAPDRPPPALTDVAALSGSMS